MIIGARGFALVASLGLACHPAPARQVADEEQARHLVIQFISLDTGRALSDSAEQSMFFCKDGLSEPGDVVHVVKSFELLQSSSAGAAVFVPVRYHVLGTAFGSPGVQFQAGSEVVTDTFQVVRDPMGQLKIGCGFHPANHMSAALLNARRSSMAPGTLAAWDSMWRP